MCDVLLQEEFTAHDESVNCVAFGHKSGQILVTGGEDKKVNFWAVGQKKCLLVSTLSTRDCFVFVRWPCNVFVIMPP